MKLNLERETLLKPLQMVMGVVERKQTLPILSNILLDASDKKISITGTDLEVELIGYMLLDASPSTEGKLTVPGRKLMDICKALPENSAIELYKDKDQVIVRSGRSRFTLSTLPAEDFPNVEQPKSDTQITVAQSELRALLQHCAFSMAQQDVRYYLNGMLFEVGSDYLRGVATDGHRLAAATLSQVKTPTQDKVQIIIPRKGVIELMRLLSNDDEPVTIEISDNHIRAQTNSYVFTSKLIEGRFPEYERVIPKNATKSISLERDYFKDALNRVAILCNEKFRGLRFEFRHNTLRILANNPEQEAAEEEVKVEYDLEDLDIGFNVSYLIDIINALDSEAVILNFSDANSSLMITEEHDNISCVYVVMPMRL
ncbi:MAG: DNA polymerase III subunit beta [Coxiella sp. (in: Bacteria)]|nr:MAG: DNA polymerase III subunit beta [Coxiella sp. (in: g-proteobacteria)]